MLAVVQDQQQPPLGQLPGQRHLGRPRLGQRQVQHRRHRLRHQLGTRQRRQLGDVDAVGVAFCQPARGLVREPGLARAARAGQGEQSGAAKRPVDLGELSPAPDKGGLLRPQTVLGARRSGRDRPRWRHHPDRRGGFRRGVLGAEQLTVEPPGRRLGVGGVLLSQRLPEPIKRRQRLVPTTARGQGRHQHPVRPLVEGIGGGHRPHDVDDLGMLVPPGQHSRVLHQQAEMALAQGRTRPLGPLLEPVLRQQITPVQRSRRPIVLRVPGVAGPPAGGIEGVGVEPRHRAVRQPHDIVA